MNNRQRGSRFFQSSSSSESSEEDETLPLSKSEVKKTTSFYLLQCRAAMSGKNIDWVKLLNSLTMLAQKIIKTSTVAREDLCIAGLRLCQHIELLVQSDAFPQDRHERRRILSPSQAKASIALMKKYPDYLQVVRDSCKLEVPSELFHESAKSTLDDLERHLITNPLSAIPIELLNTFNLVCCLQVWQRILLTLPG